MPGRTYLWSRRLPGRGNCMHVCMFAGWPVDMQHACRKVIHPTLSVGRQTSSTSRSRPWPTLSFVPPTVPLRQGGREGYMGVVRRGSSLGVGVGVSWLPSRAEVSSVARNGLRLTRRESEVSGCSFCPACLSPKKSLEGWNLLCERSEHRHNTLGVFQHHIPLSQTKINQRTELARFGD